MMISIERVFYAGEPDRWVDANLVATYPSSFKKIRPVMILKWNQGIVYKIDCLRGGSATACAKSL